MREGSVGFNMILGSTKMLLSLERLKIFILVLKINETLFQ